MKKIKAHTKRCRCRSGCKFEVGKSGAVDDRCNSWNSKRAKHCYKYAGAGTGRKGIGRCKFHGGKSPIKHGRRSKYLHEELKDKIADYLANEDVHKLDQEIGTAVVVMRKYIEEKDPFGNEERRDELRNFLSLIAVMKEKGFKIQAAWTDGRARDFLQYIAESARISAVQIFGEDERIPAFLDKLGKAAERFKP